MITTVLGSSDLVTHIFSFLSSEQVFICRGVCRIWRTCAKVETLWKHRVGASFEGYLKWRPILMGELKPVSSEVLPSSWTHLKHSPGVCGNFLAFPVLTEGKWHVRYQDWASHSPKCKFFETPYTELDDPEGERGVCALNQQYLIYAFYAQPGQLKAQVRLWKLSLESSSPCRAFEIEGTILAFSDSTLVVDQMRFPWQATRYTITPESIAITTEDLLPIEAKPPFKWKMGPDYLCFFYRRGNVEIRKIPGGETVIFQSQDWLLGHDEDEYVEIEVVLAQDLFLLCSLKTSTLDFYSISQRALQRRVVQSYLFGGLRDVWYFGSKMLLLKDVGTLLYEFQPSQKAPAEDRGAPAEESFCSCALL